MRKLIDFMNRLTDMDWGWWPMLSARPPKNQDIDSAVVLKVTPVFGTPAALIALLLSRTALSLSRFVAILCASWVFFFVAYSATFAVAWNKRARELRGARRQNQRDL